MKPYARVLWNAIKLRIHGLRCTKYKVDGIQLFGWDSKFVFGNGSKISLSERISSDGRLTVIVGNDADLEIGKYVYFNERAMISCQKKIEIGYNCKFGPNVTIIDNDHCFNANNGVNSGLVSTPIIIGKNCWIGSNVVILRGSIIEDNCIIGAGCIIKGTISKGSIVTQERQQHVKTIETEE